MKKLLIFAGTSEGRFLIDALRDTAILHVRIATDYGRRLLPKEDENLYIESGRLDVSQMTKLMESERYDAVIDTTHPYAQIVTENIKLASENTGTRYIRFLRGRQKYPESVIVAADMYEAVEILNGRDGKVLLTVGSKELEKFTKVKAYQDRIYARVLPMESVLAQCVSQGFKASQIIGMQGPFSIDMNKALIRHSKADILVTKDTGKAGGFMEKMRAALEEDIDILVVGRPTCEQGYDMARLLTLMKEEFSLQIKDDKIKEARQFENIIKEDDKIDEKATFFPMFVNSQDMKVLIVGLGNIGVRRLETMMKFSFKNITIIEKNIEKIEKYHNEVIVNHNSFNIGNINIKKREFCFKDLEDIDESTVVIASTENEDLNEQICQLSKAKTRFVNSISNKKDCTFYFSGVAVEKDIVVGITAQGKNHKLAKKVTKDIKNFLEERYE